jgi:hypothetical protein
MYATGNSSQAAVFVSTTVSSTGFMASVTAAPVGGVVGLVDILPSRVPDYRNELDVRCLTSGSYSSSEAVIPQRTATD